MPVHDAISAADALREAIAALPSGHELRPVLADVQQYVLSQSHISAGREALIAELRSIADQLATGTAATREMRAEVARMTSALADLHRIEVERASKLTPIIEAVGRRVSWAVWLQSPGRGQQLAYMISLIVLAAAAVAGNPTALATLGRIIGVSP